MTSTSQRFNERVENYVKFRPGYPQQIITYLSKNHGFKPQHICAEIGSGTGIFTQLLLENKNQVFAIEPNEQMRQAAMNNLSSFSNHISLSGQAHATTLKDHSVDYIFCAQSLHWFANQETNQEFERILKKDGKIVIIWNKKDFYKSSFMTHLRKILIQDGIDFLNVKLENIEDKEILNGLTSKPFSLFSIPTKQTLNWNDLQGRLQSMSYVPQPDHAKYEQFQSNVKILFEKENTNGTVDFLYETVVYVS